jgi:Protein-L-isoaspartate(D-aspartate) O-methyltransferase (PCMT)
MAGHYSLSRLISITESGSTTVSGADPAQQQSWLDQVYSDDSLVTQYMAHPSLMRARNQPSLVSTSSSTMPSLMARMLEALDVHDVHRVLEIGTGTGYNAALLWLVSVTTRLWWWVTVRPELPSMAPMTESLPPPPSR